MDMNGPNIVGKDARCACAGHGWTIPSRRCVPQPLCWLSRAPVCRRHEVIVVETWQDPRV